VIFTLGTGIGCGWVYKGEIFNGYKGNGMESGHCTIVINGALCGCGQRGCAESYFSARGFLSRYKEKTGSEIESARAFFELVRKKDPVAVEILSFGTMVLAELLRNTIHSVNPKKIILVGGLTKSWDLFGENLIERVKEIVFPVFLDYTTIETGSGLSSTYGAASLCFKGEQI
ncbi:MAG: ROK family protein, partial [Leptospiraceae bacterium]|nr:ROK family protein [Leptospiraceae bacterium]